MEKNTRGNPQNTRSSKNTGESTISGAAGEKKGIEHYFKKQDENKEELKSNTEKAKKIIANLVKQPEPKQRGAPSKQSTSPARERTSRQSSTNTPVGKAESKSTSKRNSDKSKEEQPEASAVEENVAASQVKRSSSKLTEEDINTDSPANVE